eukprot:2815033-Pyramimonas_sp.AAC.1
MSSVFWLSRPVRARRYRFVCRRRVPLLSSFAVSNVLRRGVCKQFCRQVDIAFCGDGLSNLSVVTVPKRPENLSVSELALRSFSSPRFGLIVTQDLA